jgi:hypothetical protein
MACIAASKEKIFAPPPWTAICKGLGIRISNRKLVATTSVPILSESAELMGKL